MSSQQERWAPSRSFAIGCVTGATAITLLSVIHRCYLSKLNEPDKGGNKLRIQTKEYKRLLLETRGKSTFQFQEVRDEHVKLCLAINLLSEYLPNSILRTLFLFVPDIPETFDIDKFLENGWESSCDTVCDAPDLFVENVLPIPNQPTLFITVGLPGSGKTTWARMRMGSDHEDRVIAADDYFDRFNGGQFDVKLLGKAHEWAQCEVGRALAAGHSVVANNTNTTLSEMNSYVAKVVFGDLPHKIVFAVMPERDLNVLFERGLHGVPMKSLKDMLKRMTKMLKKGYPSSQRVLRAGGFKRPPPRDLVCREVIYSGIFTDDETQRKVREYLMRISGKALLCDLTNVHCTLKFQPLKSDVEQLPFGKRVTLRIIAYAVHKLVQTVMVEILDEEVRELAVSSSFTHCTVSYNRSRIGPQCSNELLSYGQLVPVVADGGMLIEGTVGVFANDSKVYFEREQVPKPKEKPAKKGKGKRKQKGKKGQREKKETK